MSEYLIEPITEFVTPRSDIRAAFRKVWSSAEEAVNNGMAFDLVFKPKKNTRSVQANSCLWAHLKDVSEQVVWHGNKLTPEEWKDVFTASLKAQKSVPAIDGGYVVLGAKTSKMSIQEMGNLIELICAFGANHDVKFKAPKWMSE